MSGLQAIGRNYTPSGRPGNLPLRERYVRIVGGLRSLQKDEFPGLQGLFFDLADAFFLSNWVVYIQQLSCMQPYLFSPAGDQLRDQEFVDRTQQAVNMGITLAAE